MSAVAKKVAAKKPAAKKSSVKEYGLDIYGFAGVPSCCGATIMHGLRAGSRYHDGQFKTSNAVSGRLAPLGLAITSGRQKAEAKMLEELGATPVVRWRNRGGSTLTLWCMAKGKRVIKFLAPTE